MLLFLVSFQLRNTREYLKLRHIQCCFGIMGIYSILCGHSMFNMMEALCQALFKKQPLKSERGQEEPWSRLLWCEIQNRKCNRYCSGCLQYNTVNWYNSIYIWIRHFNFYSNRIQNILKTFYPVQKCRKIHLR